MTDSLSIRYCAPADIRPDPRNARTHSKKQVAQIAASIQAFGFTNPVLVDEDNVLIAGHGRLLAVKQAGLATIPAITLASLTDPQKRALRLADNKIAQNAGWDTDLLRIELEAITTSIDLDFTIETLGFSVGEVDVILNGDGVDPDDEVIPAAPVEPRAKPGDIWILGEHRIGCGDGRDLDLLRRVVGDGDVDAAFLDPPYNVRISGHANVKSQHREFAMASGEMTKPEFQEFLSESLRSAAAVSRPGAVHFVCMDWRHLDEMAAAGGGDAYGDLLNVCVWNKSNAGMGSFYRSKHELVFVYRVGSEPHFNAVELGKNGRNRTNVWDYASVNSFKGARREDLKLHPTVKPVALVANAIQDVTRRGELVLDTFLGSGTTLIAAERTGRRFRGLDIDPAYVDLAIERWAAMTGGEPVLEGAGA